MTLFDNRNINYSEPVKLAHRRKMQITVARKFKLNQSEIKNYEERFPGVIIQEKEIPPTANLSTFNYFLRTVKPDKLLALETDQKFTELTELSSLAKPSEIDIILSQGEDYFQKGEVRDNSNLPFLIYDFKEISVKTLSESICALANEWEGGVILICEEHSNTAISKGFKKLSQRDQRKLRKNYYRALDLIDFFYKIQIKTQGLEIYNSLQQKIQGQKARQFIIRIKVFPQRPVNNIFYVKSKNQSLEDIYSFYKISRNGTQNQSKFQVLQVSGQEIYDFMKKVAVNNSKALQRISKTKKLPYVINFNIDKFISKQVRRTVEIVQPPSTISCSSFL